MIKLADSVRDLCWFHVAVISKKPAQETLFYDVPCNLGDNVYVVCTCIPMVARDKWDWEAKSFHGGMCKNQTLPIFHSFRESKQKL